MEALDEWEEGARADIVITPHAAPPNCAAGLVVDRAFLPRSSAVAIRLTAARPVVRSARGSGGARPWRPAATVAAAPPPTSRPVPDEAAPEDADAPAEAPPESLQ
ncbi:hypothetical protein MOX02_27440 [Methylobacterium oxalidis]|uniref:Uncharacterized protein n=1 Tax=Methylobacterium oxalidis TaxID=944322 RepID=A0A512J420_9HYPH|nr:hypothetical protein MOX02_27440 [Methylobacterium oxalidis]GLS63239.1 hypothetical protein GCM10007888_16200 [Methylobacterium oxalidis]